LVTYGNGWVRSDEGSVECFAWRPNILQLKHPLTSSNKYGLYSFTWTYPIQTAASVGKADPVAWSPAFRHWHSRN